MTQYIDGIAEIPQSRCIVSDDYRTITIPAKERTLGCVGDDETRRVWFDMPLSNDGISLRGFALSIHYVNAAGNSNRYDVATAYVVDNRILFAWLVQRGAYEAAGLVSVSIKMRTLDGTTVDDEFNSAIAPFSVKDAQNFDEHPQPEQTDWVGAFIAQQSARIDAKIALADEAIADAQDATTAANTAAASATTAAQSANQAATAANSAATDASQAATDATDAAERAEQAAEGVESAIDAATAAATSANSAAATASTAAANADSKAALATQAASTANQAAQAAESATTAANTAAGQATTAAGNATTAAGAANTAATNADAKAALADTAAANADTATANANTATANANTATTNATNAAQAANNAAEYAIDAADDMPRLSTTASGTTAQTVNDAWPTTIHGATLYGKCVQDGTPTPENPVDVQIVRAPNIFDKTTATIKKYIDHSGNIQTSNGWSVSDFIPVEPRHTYVLSGVTQGWSGVACMAWYKADKSFLSYNEPTVNPLTAPENAAFIRLSLKTETPETVQFERGTVATHYCEYGCIGLQIGETVTPIDLQGHTLAGLSDGAQAVLRVDASGRVWIDNSSKYMVLDGTVTTAWTFGSGNRFYRDLLDARVAYKNGADKAICNSLPLLRNGGTSGNVDGFNIADFNGHRRIFISLSGSHPEITTTAGLVAYLGEHPMEFIYERMESQTIELGTIELPELTNPCELAIYASLDPEWAIQYEQDPNIVVNALQSSIAPVEGSTASTNYAVNSYLIHGNRLYRVTSAIATGEAITPGSNCVACTVMGELVRLTA